MGQVFARVVGVIDSGLSKVSGGDRFLLMVFRCLASIAVALLFFWMAYTSGVMAASLFTQVVRLLSSPVMLWLYGIVALAAFAYFVVRPAMKWWKERNAQIAKEIRDELELKYKQVQWGDPAPSLEQFIQADDLAIDVYDGMDAVELQEEIDHELNDGDDDFNPPDDEWKSKPPTEKQISYANDLGIKIPRKCTRGQLSDLITAATEE